MQFFFNKFNKIDTPSLTLCNPGSIFNDGLISNCIGILSDIEAQELVINFNTTSDLNFRINKNLNADIPLVKISTDDIYRSIKSKRLILVEDFGYFVITDVNNKFDNGKQYKDVTAKSIDIELEQKMIPYIPNSTYPLLTDTVNSKKGILNIITEILPLWNIGNVDNSIKEKYRTFEDIDISMNCLSFLIEKVQNAYECIIIFDTLNRIINIYDQNNYIEKTNILLTKNDIIKCIDISEDADNIYTAINVKGSNNLNISPINPTGSNIIYNFNHYLTWMSSELSSKVTEWEKAIKNKQKEYYQTSLEYHTKLKEASDLQLEFDKFSIQITMYTRCRNSIIANTRTSIIDGYNKAIEEVGGTKIVIQEELTDTLAQIDNLIAECESQQENKTICLDTLNDELFLLKQALGMANEDLFITSYFSETEYSELQNYIFECSYKDEYIATTDSMTYIEKFEQMDILYNRAKLQLDKISKPTQEFTIDADNFIFSQKFDEWTKQLKIGCLISVDLYNEDEQDTPTPLLARSEIEEPYPARSGIVYLFLSNITINFEDLSLNMTFGSGYNKFDPKSLFNNVLGDIRKSANTINYIKDTLYPIKDGKIDSMQQAIKNSRNISMMKALTSNKEEVIIDESGYTGRSILDNGSYDPHQIKITGKSIVFTDDSWETCKTTIGELSIGENEIAYGVNAETIVGDIIMGRNLKILDPEGNDLLSVVDGKISTNVKDINGRVSSLEQDADGIKIKVKELEEKETEINHIVTTTGYSFNNDGLLIQKSGEEISNLLDNTGMYVKRSGEKILTANNKGVEAINLTAKQYLIIGKNSRFEDYKNGSSDCRTACFAI